MDGSRKLEMDKALIQDVLGLYGFDASMQGVRKEDLTLTTPIERKKDGVKYILQLTPDDATVFQNGKPLFSAAFEDNWLRSLATVMNQARNAR